VRNKAQPESHLANSALQDAGATFLKLAEQKPYDFETDLCHVCVLSVPRRGYVVSRQELGDLRMLGCDSVDSLSVTAYAVAHIMGMHFRANEWVHSPRCGSVITCVLDGCSLYARVIRFLQVDNDECPGYASLQWLSKPRYPYGTPLVPVVTLDGHELDGIYGSIVRITDLDPSPVSFECNSTDDLFHLMRESGYDSTTSTQ